MAIQGAVGKLLSFHLTLGQHDFKTEFPDDESATSLLLAIAAHGNSRITTLKAYIEGEAWRIVRKLP